MASEDADAVSTEQRETSSKQLEGSLAAEYVVVSMEAASEQGVGPDHDNQSDGPSDSETASDNCERMKIGAVAALAGISYDFGQLTMMKARLTYLESVARYFSKGYARPPGAEPVSDPQEIEMVVFEDFFVVGLRIPLHPVLLDILQKFWVQLHQLTPNAIVQVGMFIWAVNSCGGHPTVDVFTHHYELHYQNKKIHLEGFGTTFATQFGCISFYQSWFGNRVRLTPSMRNKWTSG
jgi:hypothetical protein